MLKALSFAAAMTMSVLSSPTCATVVVPVDIVEDTGGFFQAVKNSFSYDYIFDLPFAGELTASLTSSAVTNPILFSSVTLNGVALVKDLSSNSYALPVALGVGAGPQVFHVAGTASNKATTFSGTIQFISAIPEPAAWVTMVLGFGALGASMRRRPVAGIAFDL